MGGRYRVGTTVEIRLGRVSFDLTIAALVAIFVAAALTVIFPSLRPKGVDLATLATLLTALFTLLLALSTANLATSTADSVALSQELKAADDIRHQQNLGPILTIEPIFPYAGRLLGLSIRNVGLGPAQDIILMLKGIVATSRTLHQSGSTVSIDLLVFHRTILEARETAHWNLEPEQIHPDGVLADSARIVAILSYFDVTGNEYKTFTSDVLSPPDMVWLRPAALYPSRTLLELKFSSLSAENLLDTIEPSRAFAETT